MGISRIGLAAALFGTSCVVPLVAIVAIDPGVVIAAAPDIDASDPLFTSLGITPGDFGADILVLENGNIVVTDPDADYDPGTGNIVDAGAVYLLDGAHPFAAPLTTYVGVATNDHIGSGGFGPGVVEVGNSNFVIVSPHSDATVTDVGAVTWVSGVAVDHAIHDVTSSDSIVGTTNNDAVGVDGIVNVGDDYVIASGDWDDPNLPVPPNSAIVDAGAVTWADGDNPISGIVSNTNSLTGASAGDAVGFDAIIDVRPNGDYIVGTPNFDVTPSGDEGAVTVVSGSTHLPVGPVTAANSLVGAVAGEGIGTDVTALTNTADPSDVDFVVSSSIGVVGATTWVDGTNGPLTGTLALSLANSIIGGAPGDFIGFGGVTPLSNGNYVVSSPLWNSGRGAVTLGNGTGGAGFVPDATNSIVGSQAGDVVGLNLGTGPVVAALDNGNAVIGSPEWDSTRGAATFIDGSNPSTPPSGTITSANSLRGAFGSGDAVGTDVVALAGSRYAVSSPGWSSTSTPAIGAVVFGGGSGITGSITATNSFHGSQPGDQVGTTLTRLANGNLAISSPHWDGPGGISDVGAVTWVDAVGRVGTPNAANSLVGTFPNDHLGLDLLIPLNNGGYLTYSEDFDPADDGVATYAGPFGAVGSPNPTNSVFGTTGHEVLSPCTCNAAGNNVTSTGAVPVPRDGNIVTMLQPDTTFPLFTAPLDVTKQVIPGTVTTPVNFTLTPPTDPESLTPPTVACDYNSGDLFPVGTTTVTCTATNEVGLQTSDSFHVVVDVLALPVFAGVPANITVATTPPGSTSRAVTYTPPTASDANGSITAPPVSCLPASGSIFAAGTTTVTCTATNVLSQSSTAQFTVTVNVTPIPVPVFGAAPDVTTVAAPGAGFAVATYTKPVATDANGAVPVNCTPSSGSPFPTGVTTVTCIATNSFPRSSSTTFSVTVVPTAVPGPVFTSAPSNILLSTAPGATTAVATYTNPTAADVSGPVPVMCAPPSGSAFPIGTTTVTCTATDTSDRSVTTTFTVRVVATPTTADFLPLTPARLADTRPAHTTADGLFAGIGVLSAGSTLELAVAGRGGVAADAGAVVLNVTVTEPIDAGFVTVYPCGAPQPTASNLNFVAGQTIANAVATKVGTSGKVCIYTQRATHLVVDVSGTFPTSSTYLAINPVRLLDSRPTGAVPAGSVTPVQVIGRAGVPAGSIAAVFNVTVTGPTGSGFVTVFPCGTTIPTASNLNFVTGQTIANLVVAKIGTDGQVCIFSQQATQLVVDIAGVFPAAATYTPLAPARLLETRAGLPTIDGESAGIGVRSPGSITTLHVAGRGGVAAGATAVVLNVTVTGALGSGYVTVFPCGVAAPNASNLNFVAGQTIAGAVIAGIGTGGNVCLLTSQSTDLVADVTGYMPG
ncbi:MAG: hypothetical protein JWN62_1753 [Acidimicrobiales bacterium]|nr:hypothetical protein [Acidimicrobiales bacterium]